MTQQQPEPQPQFRSVLAVSGTVRDGVMSLQRLQP